MNKKGIFTVFFILPALLVSVAAYAGSLNSTAAPGATNSYTLEDVYNRLDTGAAATQGTFTEPGSGPGSTGHTINDIYNLTEERAFVPKTGQTTQTAVGDDGNLEKGVGWPVPRLTDNLDGTVTDHLTGLIWLKDANCWATIDWATAITNCNNLAAGQCGLSDSSAAGDWRLPNVRELHSLIDYQYLDPALPSGHPFVNVINDNRYWTSTTRGAGGANAWTVVPQDGNLHNHGKGNFFRVLPVRDGQ
ncbi:DUF1566 domain-containing protein [Desulfococcaceae bacterium HSG8]|nr:DUF1566 domain-containing protein [Desulfococcaceae bacterium HSG8]